MKCLPELVTYWLHQVRNTSSAVSKYTTSKKDYEPCSYTGIDRAAVAVEPQTRISKTYGSNLVRVSDHPHWDFSLFVWAPPGKFRASSSIIQQPRPSKSFTVHQSWILHSELYRHRHWQRRKITHRKEAKWLNLRTITWTVQYKTSDSVCARAEDSSFVKTPGLKMSS